MLPLANRMQRNKYLFSLKMGLRDALSITWTTPQAFPANLKKKKPTIPPHANWIAAPQQLRPKQPWAFAGEGGHSLYGSSSVMPALCDFHPRPLEGLCFTWEFWKQLPQPVFERCPSTSLLLRGWLRGQKSRCVRETPLGEEAERASLVPRSVHMAHFI